MFRHPYLSAVAVSRNDDHGGDPLRRTRLFVESLAWQAQHFRLPVELVLVDWNPPAAKPGLAEVLAFPENEYFCARIIVVPPCLHAGYRHGDRLPLFQMIGKNVGIRRAKGEFILATNIDILLDDRLFAELARRSLRPDKVYRADRYDIRNEVPDREHVAQQAFCRDAANHARRNHRLRPYEFAALQEHDPWDSGRLLQEAGRFAWAEFDGLTSIGMKPGAEPEFLSTNACGDFTLMHRDAWERIHGYAEFEAFSMNIDSVGLMCAHFAGIREVSFLPPLVTYHVEHAPGSGWSPECSQTLYDRICQASLPYLDWSALQEKLVPRLAQDEGWLMNDESWGLAGFALEETIFSADGRSGVEADSARTVRQYGSLSALRQQYEPAIILQDYLNDLRKRPGPAEHPHYQRYLRLTRHRFWKYVELGISGVRMAKRAKKFISGR